MAAIGVTSSTTYASTIRTKHLLKLLNTAAGYLVANRFADSKAVGKGEGNTIRVNRILRPGIQVTASTAGELITAGQAKALYSNYEEFALEIWGDSFGIEEDVSVTSHISDADNRDVIARQLAQSLDYQVMKKICTGCMRYRADTEAGTYQKAATADDTTTSNSTTIFSGAALNQATDFWNGGFLTVTNPTGANYDITRKISDSAQTALTITTTAFKQAHDATTNVSKGWAVVGTNLTAADVVTCSHLLKVAALHEKVQTEKFSGGVYHAFIPAEVHLDLQNDTTFIDSVVYDESFHLGTYRLGRIYDIEFLTTSEPYRESAAGAEGRGTGAVFVVPVFGLHSHSIFTFANPGGTGMFGVKFYIVDKADSQNLRLGANFISWKGMYAGGVTRATSVIGLMTGASDLAVLV